MRTPPLYVSLCILASFVLLFAQECTILPQSLEQSQIERARGELSSSCYDLLEDLFLHPINLAYPNVTRLKPLGLMLTSSEEQTLAHIQDFAPYTDSLKTRFFQQVPSLVPYIQFLVWPDTLHHKAYSGQISSSFRTYPSKGEVTTLLRGVGSLSDIGLGGRTTLRINEGEALLLSRTLWKNFGSKARVAIGNPTLERNNLLWGHYLLPQSDAITFLYGTRPLFNGVDLLYQTQESKALFTGYWQGDSYFLVGGVGQKLGKLRGEVYGFWARNLKTSSYIELTLRSRHPLITGSVVVGLQRSFACEFISEGYRGDSYYHIEFFYLSPQYRAPFSYWVALLGGEERKEESAFGVRGRIKLHIDDAVVSHIALRAHTTASQTEAKGEVLLKLIRPLSVESRSALYYASGEHTALDNRIYFSQQGSVAYPLLKIAPKITVGALWEKNKKPRTTLGTQLAYSTNNMTLYQIGTITTLTSQYHHTVVTLLLGYSLAHRVRGKVSMVIPTYQESKGIRLLGELSLRF